MSVSNRSKPLVAIGYSARSLSAAMLREGFSPHAIDHFGDADLLKFSASHTRIPAWNEAGANFSIVAEPGGSVHRILQKLANLPAQIPILLAGGTENWPALQNALASNEHPVFGPKPSQIQALRSIDFYRSITENTGIGFPASLVGGEVDASQIENAGEGIKWLRKSTAGSGGLHVSAVSKADATGPRDVGFRQPIAAGTYFQQRILGRSLGVTCILSGSRPQPCRLLGATEAWNSADWPGPLEFLYRGGLGPIPLLQSQIRHIETLGSRIQHETGALGWIHFDFIEDADAKLWLLEINPRWASGMELLSLSGTDVVRPHLQAWGVEDLPSNQSDCEWPSPNSGPGERLLSAGPCKIGQRRFAKAVVYAERDLRLSPEKHRFLQQLIERAPLKNREDCVSGSVTFADIPNGELDGIEAGHPILTVLIEQQVSETGEPDRESLLSQLRKGAGFVERRLAENS